MFPNSGDNKWPKTKNGTEHVFIPFWKTCLLQPLEYVLCKSAFQRSSFIYRLDGLCCNCCKRNYSHRKTEAVQSYALASEWVLSVRNIIPNDLVAKSFKKRGTANCNNSSLSAEFLGWRSPPYGTTKYSICGIAVYLCVVFKHRLQY